MWPLFRGGGQPFPDVPKISRFDSPVWGPKERRGDEFWWPDRSEQCMVGRICVSGNIIRIWSELHESASSKGKRHYRGNPSPSIEAHSNAFSLPKYIAQHTVYVYTVLYIVFQPSPRSLSFSKKMSRRGETVAKKRLRHKENRIGNYPPKWGGIFFPFSPKTRRSPVNRESRCNEMLIRFGFFLPPFIVVDICDSVFQSLWSLFFSFFSGKKRLFLC